MDSIKLLLASLLITLSVACKKEDPIVFANEKDEDIYTFWKQLENRHVDLYHNISETAFETAITTLREQSATLSQQELIVEMMKILSKVGDAHTSLQAWSYLNFLPIEVEWLTDGVWIKSVLPGEEAALGQRIVAINGRAIEEVLDQLKTITAFDNPSNFKFLAVTYLRVPEFLQAFELTNADQSVTFNLANGQELTLRPEEEALSSIYQTLTRPLYLSNTADYYWMEEMLSDRLLYIQYNRAREQNPPSFQEFTNQVIQQIDNNAAFEKIVIDLRLNTGGNSSIARPLIDELRKRVNSGRLQAKNIYVIIGRRTFSSGLLNAWELHEAFDPNLVGEPTGGKPNHFGEIRNFSLPNSGIKVWYSTKFFELDPNADDALQPDQLIELSSEHLLQGRDPIMEYILAQ